MKHKLILFVLLLAMPFTAGAQQRHDDGIDNVLEFTPYAAVFALKACGVESRSNWTKMTATAAMSFVVSAGVATVLKHTVKEWRPDHSDQRSFPSGHTTFAFAGATVLHKEFGRVSPWISVAGYSVATLTAVDRVVKDRHHWYDVVAGAGIGVLSTELGYFVSNKIFKNENVNVAFTGNSFDVAIRW